MVEKVVWIQVLLATARPGVVRHWQEWFNAKGIACEQRPTRLGPALYRSMTGDQWAEYMSIRDWGKPDSANGDGHAK